MSQATQAFVRSRLTEVSGPIDTSVAGGAINSGDMCYWTGAGWASLTTAGASNANTASFCGVSRDTYPLGLAGGGLGPGGTNQTGVVEFGVSNTAQSLPAATLMTEGDCESGCPQEREIIVR